MIFIIILVLCLPLPAVVRGFVLRLFDLVATNTKAQMTMKIVFFLTAVLFLDALRTINHLDDVKVHTGEHASAMFDMQTKLRLFRNQRNAYITFFALFLLLVIHRFEALHRKFHVMSESSSSSPKVAPTSTKSEDVKKSE